MISPTIGRVVIVKRGSSDAHPDGWPALVNRVWSDNCINVAGFNEWGTPFSFTSIRLLQDDEPAPETGPWAEWMPYQKAQAEKHAFEADASAAVGSAAKPVADSELPNRGPRVTPADIENEIVGEHYFTAQQGVLGARAAATSDDLQSLRLLTFCVLVLANGFTVTGESACAAPENFDAEIGKRIARAAAIAKVWPLLGFRLRDAIAAS